MIFSLFSQMRPGRICQNQRAEQICPRWKRPGKAPPGRNFPGFFAIVHSLKFSSATRTKYFPARGIARHLADWTRASRFQKYFLAPISMRCVETVCHRATRVVLVVPSNRDTYLQAISLIVVSREPDLAGKSFLKPTDTLVAMAKKMDVKRILFSNHKTCSRWKKLPWETLTKQAS